MTPHRFWLATVLFHSAVAIAASFFVWRWSRPERCRRTIATWFGTLALETVVLAVVVYALSLLSAVAANYNYAGRLRLGPISLRLLGQALFVEGPMVAAGLAWAHRSARQTARFVLSGATACTLAVIHIDAYYIEPRMLVPRVYTVDHGVGGNSDRSIRILHITDIQTPTIGLHEEEALRTGLSFSPDLIVLTGDYVQDALGRATEVEAARDLRALMKDINFDAPLGVFATEGDVGPACNEVFAGSVVHCLKDESVNVALPGGETLGITGLRRSMGRESNPAVLRKLLNDAPAADHRIVISHAPDFISAMPFNVDLALAGHTHGGQVVIPFFGPPKTAIRLPRRYAGGLNDYRGTPIHVSRGVGMERGFDIPVRFLCPPEIGIIDLRLARRVSRIVANDQAEGRGADHSKEMTVAASPSHWR